MKNQIMTFIIGVLVGAIITTAIFLIFKPNNSSNVPTISRSNRSSERIKPTDKASKSNSGKTKKDKNTTSESNNTTNENNTKTNEKNG